MIVDALGRAIVAILGKNEELLGTGFLIGPSGEVLTARHILSEIEAVKVQFQDHQPIDARRVDQNSGADDWAIVRVEIAKIPVGVAPVPWSPLGDLGDDEKAEWFSIGHAGLREGQRGGFHGRVIVASKKLEAFCTELHRAFYDDARGLSGAPCVVGREVVGLIIDVLVHKRQEPAPIVAGQVIALPLQMIAAQSEGMIPDESTELPWQTQFTGAIQELTEARRMLAAQAALVRNPITGPRLPRRVARQMIHGGVFGTLRVVERINSGFRNETVDELMGRAYTLWVDDESAKSLATIAATPDVGLLTTEFDWSAESHFDRAVEYHRMHMCGSDSWDYILVKADIYAKSIVDDVVEKIQAELASNVLGKRIVAFVHCPPSRDLVQRLREEQQSNTDWKQVAVVFMSQAFSNDGSVPVVCVTPGPRREDEMRAEREKEAALKALANLKRRVS